VGVEGFLAPTVVVGIVCVKPIALGVHVEVCDFCELRRFDEELLLFGGALNAPNLQGARFPVKPYTLGSHFPHISS
jgi:hypothetical protein